MPLRKKRSSSIPTVHTPVEAEPEEYRTLHATPEGEMLKSAMPWPRDEDTEIPFKNPWNKLLKEMALSGESETREFTEYWDDFDSLFYNGWWGVNLEPTRFADESTLRLLGIKDEVIKLLKNASLGIIATRYYPHYPDLARQLLAMIRVDYNGHSGYPPEHGDISFRIRGVRYVVTFDELAYIYGFAKGRSLSFLPAEFEEKREFWALFGTGALTSNSTLIDIRHPVLRYFVRLVASSILYQVEANKARVFEHFILYYALRPYLPTFQISLATDVHMGDVFAHHLLSLKTIPYKKGSSNPVTAGSLFTTIFRFLEIDITPHTMETTPHLIDLESLQRATWLKMPTTWIYQPTSGVKVQVKLPIS